MSVSVILRKSVNALAGMYYGDSKLCVGRRLIQADTVIDVPTKECLCQVLVLDHRQLERRTLEFGPAHQNQDVRPRAKKRGIHVCIP